MKRKDVKSLCPINFTLEIFGDPWSLLIVRDMATLGKKTFSDFMDSEEHIGTSVLAERLAHLEKKGIIAKKPDEVDKRKTIYTLTLDGIRTLPILYEIAAWGLRTSPNPKATAAWFKSTKLKREVVLMAWRRALYTNSSFFIGPNSVVEQLGL
ncbi:transcriptional regulator, HxlR family [candidate division TM7 genomosp. GTL1]|nr:transcriptional regulator, HxlR family [candidate division TM7 genomosp. GTL1]